MLIDLKRINLRSLFIRITISYLVILLIVLSSVFAIYNWLHNNLEREIISRGEKLIEQVKTAIDSQLMEVQNSAIQISQNKSILRLSPVILQDTVTRYRWAMDLSDSITDYSFTNKIVLDTIVYFKKDGIFVKPGLASIRPELFYDSEVKYEGMTYKEWKNTIFSSDNPRNYFLTNVINADKTSKEVLICVYYLTGNISTNPSGCILIHIDINEILRQLETEVFGEKTMSMILDDKGRILVSHNINSEYIGIEKIESTKTVDFKGFEQKKYTVLKTGSDINQWEYVTLIPYNSLMKSINSVKTLFLILFVALSLSGTAMTIYIAYKNTKPIRDIISIFNPSSKDEKYKDDELHFIRGSIHNLIQNNNTLKNELDEQKKKQKSAFISQLLFGEFNNDKEIQEYIDYTGLEEIKSDQYVVVIGSIKEFGDNFERDYLDKINKHRVILKHVINENTKFKVFATGVRRDRVGIIVCINENVKKQEIERLFNDISNRFLSEFKILCTFAASRTFNNLSLTPTAYIQAISLFDSGIPSRELLWFEEDVKPVSGYYYPIEFESRIVCLMKVGEYNGVKNIFDEIKLKNDKIDFYCFKFLVMEINSTLLKVVFQFVQTEEKKNELVENIMKINKSSITIEEYITRSLKAVKVICSEISNTLIDKNVKLKSEIMEFINENYLNIDINLNMLANQFNFTEKYFSKVFKELTGENITTCIEKLRMEKTIHLMKQSDLTILEIAQKVGYSNQNTFYKAFKRNYSISPGEYREKLQ